MSRRTPTRRITFVPVARKCGWSKPGKDEGSGALGRSSASRRSKKAKLSTSVVRSHVWSGPLAARIAASPIVSGIAATSATSLWGS
jgi:hypothetical protein